jgi:hypothetical protein
MCSLNNSRMGLVVALRNLWVFWCDKLLFYWWTFSTLVFFNFILYLPHWQLLFQLFDLFQILSGTFLFVFIFWAILTPLSFKKFTWNRMILWFSILKMLIFRTNMGSNRTNLLIFYCFWRGFTLTLISLV